MESSSEHSFSCGELIVGGGAVISSSSSDVTIGSWAVVPGGMLEGELMVSAMVEDYSNTNIQLDSVLSDYCYIAKQGMIDVAVDGAVCLGKGSCRKGTI